MPETALGSRTTTASPSIIPFLVPPSDSTSTPRSVVISRSDRPRWAAASASRDPSMWTRMPGRARSRELAHLGGRVDGSRTRWPGSGRRPAAAPGGGRRSSTRAAQRLGVSRPSGAGTVSSFTPPMRSGAPFSSVLRCATSVTDRGSPAGEHRGSETTFAPVPLMTGYATARSPNRPRTTSVRRSVHGSSPYERRDPRSRRRRRPAPPGARGRSCRRRTLPRPSAYAFPPSGRHTDRGSGPAIRTTSGEGRSPLGEVLLEPDEALQHENSMPDLTMPSRSSTAVKAVVFSMRVRPSARSVNWIVSRDTWPGAPSSQTYG